MENNIQFPDKDAVAVPDPSNPIALMPGHAFHRSTKRKGEPGYSPSGCTCGLLAPASAIDYRNPHLLMEWHRSIKWDELNGAVKRAIEAIIEQPWVGQFTEHSLLWYANRATGIDMRQVAWEYVRGEILADARIQEILARPLPPLTDEQIQGIASTFRHMEDEMRDKGLAEATWGTYARALEELLVLRKAVRWIPVTERNPEPMYSDGDNTREEINTVYIYGPKLPGYHLGYRIGGHWKLVGTNSNFDDMITHWHPILPPPEAQ